MPMDLCHPFMEASQWVWNWLKSSGSLGILPSETTITEVELWYLAKRCSPWLRVHKFTPTEESRYSGADWEWFIFDDPCPPLHLRIQAKKFHRPSNRYDLSHRPDHTKLNPNPPLQIERLLTSAAAVGAVPLYCFYNSADPGVLHAHQHCCCEPAKPESLGCSLASAVSLRKEMLKLGIEKLPAGVVDAIHEPWQSMFCCGTTDDCLSRKTALWIATKLYKETGASALSLIERWLSPLQVRSPYTRNLAHDLRYARDFLSPVDVPSGATETDGIVIIDANALRSA
jgi:hypothetical protein